MCHLVGVVQTVHTNPHRNFSLGIFAYHLYKPSTNRFSHVNGKQPPSSKQATQPTKHQIFFRNQTILTLSDGLQTVF